MRIPKEAKDFTVDWLNSALASSGKLGRNQITTCGAVDSDIPGQTAEIILINVTYKDISSNLPTKMVAKVTSRNPIVLAQVIANYDQYRRETSFYREFPDIGIAIPQCLYEKHNPETQECVILMEDLAPAESPSWAITTNQVKDALSHLPAFHAKWWNHPRLKRQDWMVQNDNHAFYAAGLGAAHGAAKVIDSLYEDAGTTIQIMEVMENKVGSFIKYISTQPLTFVHGDYHAKQMFFPTAAGGQFAVIDWQFPFVAQGAWDFARMLGMCMSTEDRRKNEAKLLLKYHRQLMSLGIKDYDMNHLQNDYRMGLIISQMIMVIAAADTDIELMEKECTALGVDWRDAMFNRTQHALEDWNVLDFAQSL